MLSPELLNTFITIVRTEGDATLAADILKINQPSMSKRLAFLQHAGRILRKPWIERIGKSWHLTPEGDRVLPAVEELVHRYKLLTEALEEDRPAVIFGCGSAVGSGVGREALKAFRTLHPNSYVRCSNRPALARVEGVGNGSLDIACVRFDEAETYQIAHRSLFVEDLFEDSLMLVAVPGCDGFEEFQQLPDKHIPPKALTKFPLLLPDASSGIRKDFERKCRDAGILDRLIVSVEASPARLLREYVCDGFGVGLLPKSAIKHDPNFVVKTLPPKMSPPNMIRVIARKKAGSDDLDLSKEGFAFLGCLREAAKQSL
jgi:DNA-binding transcriptional LysR family regulator